MTQIISHSNHPWRPCTYCIAGYFPRCKFSWIVSFSFSRNFPDLEIHEPYCWKISRSDNSYKAYMGKTIICHTLAISTIIIVFYSCMVTTCTCICTGVSKNSRFSTVYVHKESSLIWLDPVQCRAFITCSISTQPRHSLWLLCYVAIYVCWII